MKSMKSTIAQYMASTSSSPGTTTPTTTTPYSSQQQLSQKVDKQDKDGNTALHGAVFAGHLEMVKYLVTECGASLTLGNGLDCSPVWIAAGYGRLEILRYLMECVMNNDDDTNEDDETKEEEENETKRMEDDNNNNDTQRILLLQMLRTPNNTGDTPLLAAVSKSHLDVSRLLLTRAHNTTSPSSSVSSMALEMVTDVNQSGDTPLSVCVGMDHEGALLDLLLGWEKQFRIPTTPPPPPSTPTPTPTTTTPPTLMPMNTKNKKGVTPLLVACERNSAAAVETLLRSGGIDLALHLDEKGRSILAVASFCGCDDVVKMILSLMPNTSDGGGEEEKGAEESYVPHTLLNQRDGQGCTPVWLASRTGNAKMVQILVEGGANLDMVDDVNGDSGGGGGEESGGLTPEEVAVRFKKDKVCAYFRELAAATSQ